MKQTIIIIFVAIIILILFIALFKKNKKFNIPFIKVWIDHVVYTRMFIVSSLNNLENLGVVTKRLLRNQDDISYFFKKKYGSHVAELVSKLLKEHIMIANDLVNNIKNKKDYKIDMEKWKQNAKKIAEALHSLNKSVSINSWYSMMNQHLDLTADELLYNYNKDWLNDLETFDKIKDQAVLMATHLCKII